jgi:hypothetical protein
VVRNLNRRRIHTLVRLGDVIITVNFHCLTRVVDDQRNVLLVVKSNVRVADDVHGELELASLGWGLELHLHRHHLKGRGAVLVECGLVEGRETERWHSDLALPGVREKDVPFGLSVAGKIRCVCKGNVVLLSLLVLCLEVALCGIRVFEIRCGDWWDFGGAWRNEASLDSQLNERRRDDVLLTLNLEESLLDSKVGQLTSDLLSLLETIVGQTSCLSECLTLL